MAEGHTERNLAAIRQLEAETGQLLASRPWPYQERAASLPEAAGAERWRTTWRGWIRLAASPRPVPFFGITALVLSAAVWVWVWVC